MRWPVRVLGFLALLALPLVIGQLPPVQRTVLGVVELMREGTVVGVLAFVAAFIVGCVTTAPVWIFSGMAGYVYGPVRGILIASPANVLGMTLTFLLGRFVLSRPISARLARSPRWGAIHRAVSDDALRIGFLLRLSPIAPQNLLSYGFSLTSMRLRTFVAVTWIGLLPIISFQVYVGSLMHDVAELLEGKRPPMGALGWAATGAGIVVTVIALVLVTRLAQRALKRAGV